MLWDEIPMVYYAIINVVRDMLEQTMNPSYINIFQKETFFSGIETVLSFYLIHVHVIGLGKYMFIGNTKVVIYWNFLVKAHEHISISKKKLKKKE